MTGLFKGKPIDYHDPEQCREVIEYLSRYLPCTTPREYGVLDDLPNDLPKRDIATLMRFAEDIRRV